MKNLVLTFFLMVVTYSSAQAVEYVTGDDVFLDGYDPVSYFNSKSPIKGTEQFSYDYDGIKIYFSSSNNKEAFIKNPAKYMPQYKGWCAYAMADSGKLVAVDPTSYKIVDGKLYLFYNRFWARTLKMWNKKDDKPQIETANENWEKVNSSH